ncbi:MAG: AAA-like domain-containing protein [Lachnospiraceae bacterium]
MGKIFNVSADCKPNLHYMVDITERLQKIKEFVDRGEYFTINRARQYGKTTTLRALKRYLINEYVVISMDFQKLGTGAFINENVFSLKFARYFLNVLKYARHSPENGMEDAVPDSVNHVLLELEEIIRTEKGSFSLFELFLLLSQFCASSDKPVVLIIDEVDSVSNNQVFLDFLAQLRGYYIDRDETAAFRSVILASVYDIRNLKLKIRDQDDHITNSPWNITADFNVDMSLSEQGIAGMLEEYEQDCHSGMNIQEIAALLYGYTAGYPYLVSRLCKLIDVQIAGNKEFPDKTAAWTKNGFLAAARILLTENNTLFESLDNKLLDFPELKELLKNLLLRGKTAEYVPGDMGIRTAVMFGFIVLENGVVSIANRIFETRLYNGFLAEQSRYIPASLSGEDVKNQFISNGHLDMDLVLHKFVSHYTELFGNSSEKFLEDNGRCIFLLYMKSIINGTGNYYIEAHTRTNRRTDVIIDFRGKQYIIELKIWHGLEYNHRGEEQLSEYLDSYKLKRGYMVSFNFNKNKEVGINKVLLGDKVLIEAVV